MFRNAISSCASWIIQNIPIFVSNNDNHGQSNLMQAVPTPEPENRSNLNHIPHMNQNERVNKTNEHSIPDTIFCLEKGETVPKELLDQIK